MYIQYVHNIHPESIWTPTNFNVQKALPKRLHNSLWYKITLLKYESKILSMEHRPRGPMDKASDFESEDCGFDPHRGQFWNKTKFKKSKM